MEQVQKKSVFETLNAVNCNEHTEKKNGLTYLSWAWAWAEVKKRYPLSYYKIYEDEGGRPYFTDGRTCWVKTGVIVAGMDTHPALGETIEHIEYLPIMDYNNRSIPLEKVTSTDVNKSIQRSLTKACARHGLGLYIYAGEDLPEGEPEKAAEKPAESPKPTRTKKTSTKEEKAVQAPVSSPAKKVVTDQNIKKIVDWVCAVPEGEQRDERMKKAEDSYEWPGQLLNAFYAMVDLS